MRVDALIKLLQDWEKKHGPDAQISVPRNPCEVWRGGMDKRWNGAPAKAFGEEIYIHNEPIATVLQSRGEEVQF